MRTGEHFAARALLRGSFAWEDFIRITPAAAKNANALQAQVNIVVPDENIGCGFGGVGFVGSKPCGHVKSKARHTGNSHVSHLV